MDPTLQSLAQQQGSGLGGENLWSLLMMNPSLLQQFFGAGGLEGMGIHGGLSNIAGTTPGGLAPGGEFGTTGSLTDPQGTNVPEFNNYQSILAGGGPGSLGQANPPNVSSTNIVSDTFSPAAAFFNI